MEFLANRFLVSLAWILIANASIGFATDVELAPQNNVKNASVAVPAKQPLPLSLKEATTRALMGSRMVKKAKETYNAAREDVSVARTAFLPTVRFETNVGTLHDRQANIGELAPPAVARDRNQYDAQVVLSLPIFSGFHDLNDVRARNAATSQEEWKLKSTALDASIDVIQLYFGLQLAQAELSAENEVSKMRGEQWSEVKNRLAHGRATQLEALEAEYAVSAQGPSIKSLEHEIVSKSLLLARYIDLPLDQGFTLTDTLTDIGSVLGSAKLPDITEAYKIAVRESPRLRVAEYTKERIDLEYARDSAKHYPELAFEASGGYHSNLKVDFGTEDSRQYSGMLKLKVPLFSGLSSFDERRANAARLAAAEEDLGLARESLLQQLTDAYGDLELAEARIVAEKKNTELTSRAVSDARSLFQVGRLTQSSVLESYSRDLNARKNYAKALYDRIISLAKVRSLTAP